MLSILHNALCFCSPCFCRITVKMNLGHIIVTSTPLVSVELPVCLLVCLSMRWCIVLIKGLPFATWAIYIFHCYCHCLNIWNLITHLRLCICCVFEVSKLALNSNRHDLYESAKWFQLNWFIDSWFDFNFIISTQKCWHFSVIEYIFAPCQRKVESHK